MAAAECGLVMHRGAAGNDGPAAEVVDDAQAVERCLPDDRPHMTPEVGEHARADLVGRLAAARSVLPGIETDGAKPGAGERLEHRAHVGRVPRLL